MILYKYPPPDWLDVLEHKKVRFTQPGDFNDPFEFRPQIQAAVSDKEVQTYVENNFERLVEQELAQYGTLTQLIRSLAASFPRAVLLKAREDTSGYGLVGGKIS